MDGDLLAHVENEKRQVLPARGRRGLASALPEGRLQAGEITLEELEHPHLERERPPYA